MRAQRMLRNHDHYHSVESIAGDRSHSVQYLGGFSLLYPRLDFDSSIPIREGHIVQSLTTTMTTRLLACPDMYFTEVVSATRLFALVTHSCCTSAVSHLEITTRRGMPRSTHA